MPPWNVVVTCRRRGEGGALRELRFFGRFHSTGFRDALAGYVEDRPRFFEELLSARGVRDPLWRYVRRIVPIDETFSFTLETFREILGRVIEGMAPRVPPGAFYVRLERRGHKGEIPTPDIEREMDARIIAVHERMGYASRVDFADPVCAVAVETFGDVGGVGLVLRDESEKFPFVRVP